MKRYNNENLIQFDEMPPECHRELSARGGRASGESKRRKIEMREQLIALMEYNAMRNDLQDELLQAVKGIRKRERRQRDREHKQKRREQTGSEPRKIP